MSSVEEAEAEEQEVDSFFTKAEATEVVWKLLSAKALGMDEIHTQYFKSPSVLSWLTCLCSMLGTVPLDWHAGVVAPMSKKGDWTVCSTYQGIDSLASLEKSIPVRFCSLHL